MKNIYILTLFVLFTGCGVHQVKTWQELANVTNKDAQSLSYQIEQHVTWDDNFRDVRDPQKIIEIGKTNCAGFANLTCEILNLWGWKPQLISLKRKKGPGHRICAYFDGKYWNFFSNGKFIPTQEKTLADFWKELKYRYDVDFLKFLTISRESD